MQEIIEKITADKIEAIKAKQQSVDNFIKQIKTPHKYLTQEQIILAFRSSAPKSKLKFPLINEKVLKRIIGRELEVLSLKLYKEELLIEIQETFRLPFSDKEVSYHLNLHIDLDSLLEDIWNSKDLNFAQVIKEAKKEHEEDFLHELRALVNQCAEYATLLHFSDEELHLKIYEFY